MDVLPNVLIDYICSYLKKEDINNFSRVSTRMSNIVFKYRIRKYYVIVNHLENHRSCYRINKYLDNYTRIIIHITEDNTILRIYDILEEFANITKVKFIRKKYYGHDHDTINFFALRNINELKKVIFDNQIIKDKNGDILKALTNYKKLVSLEVDKITNKNNLTLLNKIKSIRSLYIKGDTNDIINNLDIIGLKKIHIEDTSLNTEIIIGENRLPELRILILKHYKYMCKGYSIVPVNVMIDKIHFNKLERICINNEWT